MDERYRSRFFTAPGLLIDVDQVVAVSPTTMGDDRDEWRIGFRNGSTIYTTAEIAEAVIQFIGGREHDRFEKRLHNGMSISYDI